jgi:AcrR family transcriptional regulator
MARNLPASDRRRQFIAAARRAIKEKGTFGVTIRDVAKEAGVSPAAILYHYRNFDALLLAAWEQCFEQVVTLRQHLLEAVTDHDERLATLIRYGLPTEGSEDDLYVIYASIGEYGHDAALRATARSVTHREIALYQTVLESGAAAGSFTLAQTSLTIARTLVSMEHGLGIWVVHDDPQVTVVEAERLLRVYAEQATGTVLPAPRDVARLELARA